jgi:hypothetical protein
LSVCLLFHLDPEIKIEKGHYTRYASFFNLKKKLNYCHSMGLSEIFSKTTTQRHGRRSHPSADSARRMETNLPGWAAIDGRSMRTFRNREFSLIASSE